MNTIELKKFLEREDVRELVETLQSTNTLENTVTFNNLLRIIDSDLKIKKDNIRVQFLHLLFNCAPNLFKTIDEIPYAAFYSCNWLESLIIPKNIVSIGQDAFYNCYCLNELNFEPNSKLRSICKDAFKQCYALKSIELPEGLKTLGHDAFRMCVNLNKIILPSTLTTISGWCFADCYKLKNLFYRGTKKDWYEKMNIIWAGYYEDIKEIICADGIIDENEIKKNYRKWNKF